MENLQPIFKRPSTARRPALLINDTEDQSSNASSDSTDEVFFRQPMAPIQMSISPGNAANEDKFAAKMKKLELSRKKSRPPAIGLKTPSKVDLVATEQFFVETANENVPCTPRNQSFREPMRTPGRFAPIIVDDPRDSIRSNATYVLSTPRMGRSDMPTNDPFTPLIATPSRRPPTTVTTPLTYEEKLERQFVALSSWANVILDSASFVSEIDLGTSKQDASRKLQEMLTKKGKGGKGEGEGGMKKYTEMCLRWKCLDYLKRADSVYQSITIPQQLKAMVERGDIGIKPDIEVYANIGVQTSLLSLLFSLHPFWLFIGVETVCAEYSDHDTISLDARLPFSSSTFAPSTVRFIHDQILANAKLMGKKKYAIGTVKKIVTEKGREVLHKHCITSILSIAVLLEYAKNSYLFENTPGLFVKNSDIKTVADFCTELSRLVLSASGTPLNKAFDKVSFRRSYRQSFLEEYQYVMKSVRDMADGIILGRLVELLTDSQPLSIIGSMRNPQGDRIRKKGNVEKALAAAGEHGIDVSGISIDQILAAHRETCLHLMWRLVGVYVKKREEREPLRRESLCLDGELEDADETVGAPLGGIAEPAFTVYQQLAMQFGVKLTKWCDLEDGVLLSSIWQHYNPHAPDVRFYEGDCLFERVATAAHTDLGIPKALTALRDERQLALFAHMFLSRLISYKKMRDSENSDADSEVSSVVSIIRKEGVNLSEETERIVRRRQESERALSAKEEEDRLKREEEKRREDELRRRFEEEEEERLASEWRSLPRSSESIEREEKMLIEEGEGERIEREMRRVREEQAQKEEERRLREEEEERERVRMEEEARLAAEEDERLRLEEEARLRREEEEERKRVEEARLKAEEEERMREEEERRVREMEEARMRAEEEERVRLEEERREKEARIRAEEEERKRLEEEEARIRAEEEERKRLEEEQRLKEEEEARLRAEEGERVRLEEEVRLKAEEEERLRLEEEARLRTEEAERLRLEKEARLRAEEAERIRLEEEARLRAEEEERLRLEEEARLRAEEEERARLEEERRVREEEEARQRAIEEERRRVEEEERRRREEEEARLRREREENAALDIQCWFRRAIAARVIEEKREERRKEEEEGRMRRDAAEVIRHWIEDIVMKRRAAKEREERKRMIEEWENERRAAVRKIEPWFIGRMAIRAAREELQMRREERERMEEEARMRVVMERAAITIQRFYRGCKAVEEAREEVRRRMEERREREQRLEMERKQREREEEEERVREMEARRQEEEIFKKQREEEERAKRVEEWRQRRAVRVIESAVKQYLTKKRSQKRTLDFLRVVNGGGGRGGVRETIGGYSDGELLNGVRHIQRRQRKLSLTLMRMSTMSREKAAVRIQAWWRGIRCRRAHRVEIELIAVRKREYAERASKAMDGDHSERAIPVSRRLMRARETLENPQRLYDVKRAYYTMMSLCRLSSLYCERAVLLTLHDLLLANFESQSDRSPAWEEINELGIQALEEIVMCPSPSVRSSILSEGCRVAEVAAQQMYRLHGNETIAASGMRILRSMKGMMGTNFKSFIETNLKFFINKTEASLRRLPETDKRRVEMALLKESFKDCKL